MWDSDNFVLKWLIAKEALALQTSLQQYTREANMLRVIAAATPRTGFEVMNCQNGAQA